MKKSYEEKKKAITFAAALNRGVEIKEGITWIDVWAEIKKKFFENIEEKGQRQVLWKFQMRINSWVEIRQINNNEEFDPGSGWTLAAGLTHASRGVTGELALADDRRTGE